jgi:hypothetical protein
VTDDAYVASNSADGNFGGATQLRIRSVAPTYRSYLKFTVSGLAGTVTSATLRLRVYDGGDQGGSVYGVSNSWTESGLTWNNAPPLSGSPLDSLGAVMAGTWVEFDVTDSITGDGTYSFGIGSPSSNLVGYRASEYGDPSHRPELLIQTSD